MMDESIEKSDLEKQTLTESQRNLKNPILWFEKTQMTGDEIFLLSDTNTKKLDRTIFIHNIN